MKLIHLLLLLILLFLIHGCGGGGSDILAGYKVSLAVPTDYIVGFGGRAFIMETNQNQMVPNFRVALSVESVEQRYTCSLDVFLGDVRVWSSGHFSPFFTAEICELELTQNGDLQLKGQKELVGWRSGTVGQGVQEDKLALYLNSGGSKYAYWEFKPSLNRTITFIKVGTKGLDIFGDKYTKIARIPSGTLQQPLRFLALGNETGNLGLYYYSNKGKFEASYQALSSKCDLPLACKPYGICTLSNVCSCIRFITRDGMNSGCSNGTSGGGFCGKALVEMVELRGVTSVLKGDLAKVGIHKEECADLCVEDCDCLAALYSSSSEECYLYGLVRGVKQVWEGNGWSYMVKVPKGGGGDGGKSSGLRKWAVVAVGAADGLIIVLVLGGLGFYVVHKRRKILQSGGGRHLIIMAFVASYQVINSYPSQRAIHINNLFLTVDGLFSLQMYNILIYKIKFTLFFCISN
ncbi:G-type lectin S-receptor-like serine/threonine-protein kinase At5g35370 isoform X2 [Diospyros lotus]|uniref:G-type lectin S-receptor-like serine/threonine-protein kinase At5g35370 isoform X2 n=1 Tax=Diospyros lotus TaxID=55363 RepID=UPI002255CFB1|nr:G-type lectin S-receptor-like serine/threonine-protein kinase At5g35370 isoform X2 [Diospyros lotus]